MFRLDPKQIHKEVETSGNLSKQMPKQVKSRGTTCLLASLKKSHPVQIPQTSQNTSRNMTGVVLDVVEKTNDVGVRRKKLVPRSDRLEAKEKKIPDDILVVVVQLVQASHDVAHAQLVLGVLEQTDECLSRPILELCRCYRHIKTVLPEYGRPKAPHSTNTGSRETYLNCLVLRGGASLKIDISGFQSIVLGVRGISFIPRASALWEFPTCAGGIKPTAEARPPGTHLASSCRCPCSSRSVRGRLSLQRKPS